MASTICPLTSTLIQNRDCQNSSKLFGLKRCSKRKSYYYKYLLVQKWNENYNSLHFDRIIWFFSYLSFPPLPPLLHDYSPSWARDGGSGKNPVSRPNPKHLPSVVRSRRTLRVRSFGMIQIRIRDPRSLRSWHIKGTEKSLPRVDSLVPLMRHDLSNLGSLILIWIIPKERTLKVPNGLSLRWELNFIFM